MRCSACTCRRARRSRCSPVAWCGSSKCYDAGMMKGLVIAVLALAACDTRAKASDPNRAGDRSKEYESCSSTAQCADELRCFDHTCRRTSRSAVGDYFAALGAQQRKAGDLEGAIDAYNRAIGT